MTNLNAAAIDAAVIALKVHGGFDETETDDDPIWREEAETAVSAYLAALPEPDEAFEDAVSAFRYSVFFTTYNAYFGDGTYDHLADEDKARQAVIDLYREAAR